MSDSFILDFNLLAEHGLSLDEFVALVNISRNTLNSKEILLSLQSKQFIKLIDESVILRERGKIFIELISIDKMSPKAIKKKDKRVDEKFSSFIKEYRALWKGLRPGSMGSLLSCTIKLTKWMNENPEYSKNDIIKAAKIYLKSIEDMKYLQRADYFVSKTEGGVESSRLSAFIDEIDIKPIDDWTTKLL